MPYGKAAEQQMSIDQTNHWQGVMRPDGSVAAMDLAKALGIDANDLAMQIGLGRGAAQPEWPDSPAIQARLRHLVTIVNAVLPWSESLHTAYQWYRHQVLSSYGVTAAELVKTGRGELVTLYLHRIGFGGYA